MIVPVLLKNFIMKKFIIALVVILYFLFIAFMQQKTFETFVICIAAIVTTFFLYTFIIDQIK